jgi:hypothetical protein
MRRHSIYRPTRAEPPRGPKPLPRHHPIRIIDAPPDTAGWTSFKRARKAVELGFADWIEPDRSIRFRTFARIRASLARSRSTGANLPEVTIGTWRSRGDGAAVLQPHAPRNVVFWRFDS